MVEDSGKVPVEARYSLLPWPRRVAARVPRTTLSHEKFCSLLQTHFLCGKITARAAAYLQPHVSFLVGAWSHLPPPCAMCRENSVKRALSERVIPKSNVGHKTLISGRGSPSNWFLDSGHTSILSARNPLRASHVSSGQRRDAYDVANQKKSFCVRKVLALSPEINRAGLPPAFRFIGKSSICRARNPF